MNCTSWVQICWRLLLKVTEIRFWKSYFYQKNHFSFAFCTFISVICYFIFHHQTISSWFKKLYPGVMSHLKLAKFSWNWPSGYGRRFLDVVNVFSPCCCMYHLPLEKGVALYLKKLESPAITQVCFVPSLVEISSVVLEKKLNAYSLCDQCGDGVMKFFAYHDFLPS